MLSPQRVTLPNSVSLSFVQTGDPDGIPVIFLHGFADSWHSWSEVLAHMPAWIRSIALTQRGHGDADHPETGYTVNDFTSDLAQFIEVMEIPTAVIVGHSMGSGAAIRFALDFPNKTIGIVLIGAAPSIAGTEAAKRFWDSKLEELTDPIDRAFLKEMTEASLAKPVRPEIVEAAVRESAKVPAFVWRKTMKARWSRVGDYENELGEIKLPTFIVWGNLDARYSRREQDSLATAISGSRLIVYEGFGHMLHWEAPERFASDLIKFVQGINGSERFVP